MIVRMNDVFKRYARNEALRGLTLAVPEGSAYALVGANGAGKTTAIKVLMNLLEPTRGAATVLGVDSRKLSPRELARIGYVSENQSLPGRFTVQRYLSYLRPFYPTWDAALEASLQKQLRLPPDRRIAELSHGMRMKMSLLCALSFRPEVLVLDEPFSGLDPLMRDELMETLLPEAGEMTILISSHELAEIEGMVTHVGFLDEGRLLFEESMSDLSGRLRQVRVTLENDAVATTTVPPEWLQVRATGNVLSFVDTQFAEDTFHDRIASLLQGVRHVDVQPIALRSIFTALARAAQTRGART